MLRLVVLLGNRCLFELTRLYWWLRLLELVVLLLNSNLSELLLDSLHCLALRDDCSIGILRRLLKLLLNWTILLLSWLLLVEM